MSVENTMAGSRALSGETVVSDTRSPDEWLPVLLLLFVGSGAAALIYEIVWFQLLELFIGSSAVSIAVLLGTFMGGMCLGSLLLSRVVSRERHALRVYAVLELGIGACGVSLLFVMPLVGRLYTSWGIGGLGGFLLRGGVAGLCLLPPTFAMGATLPAIARWVEATPSGVANLGLFYAGNNAGGVFGTLVAGFYLLRVHDMWFATFVAVAINLLVAAAAMVLAGRVEAHPGPVKPAAARADASAWRVYVAVGLSGFCALAGEVIWTRLLGLLFGASVYALSLIVAVFLIGLGLGSTAGSLASRATRARTAFGWCQLLLVAAVAWTANEVSVSLPFWPVNPALSPSMALTFKLDF